jgi:dihydrolipoamide dehydrogenase
MFAVRMIVMRFGFLWSDLCHDGLWRRRRRNGLRAAARGKQAGGEQRNEAELREDGEARHSASNANRVPQGKRARRWSRGRERNEKIAHEAVALDADKLIISIGRVPNTMGLNTEAVGLQLDELGAVVVDADCKTNLPGVWAVGDVVRGPMLAHKAEEEGVAVAERIAGQHGHVNFNTIPWVIYTSPEIAWVGRTEQQLKADGVAYKAGSFPFLANGRARALGDTTGMVKMLADATTDEILGVHIVGPQASELIAEAVVAMEFRASAEDIARICHAHPSLSESTKEAALAVDKRSLNF